MNTIVQNNKKKENAPPVSVILESMQKNDTQSFPISRKHYIRNRITDLQQLARSKKKDLQFTTKVEGGLFKVTRTA